LSGDARIEFAGLGTASVGRNQDWRPRQPSDTIISEWQLLPTRLHPGIKQHRVVRESMRCVPRCARG
jgi:hypothetical protein